jgi:phosphoglycolate phosphatase-like HAD superfamily hydrolase
MDKMNLEQFKLIFWDFDGVIKDSVEVKTFAFMELFEAYGKDVEMKIYNHNQTNGGMTRFEKIPLYLKWSNQTINDYKVKNLCEKFSSLVEEKVINSEWVSGVESYLRNNEYSQTFIVISSTPQNELERILSALDLNDCFTLILGSPKSKIEWLNKTINKLKVDKKDCLMIGDMKVDYEAALINDISFLLRKHPLNKIAFSEYKGDSFEDFLNCNGRKYYGK